MKKIILSLSFIVLTVFIVPLNAQTLNYDYNPWKYMREELVVNSLRKMQLVDSQDCENVQEAIDRYAELRKEAAAEDSMRFEIYFSLRNIVFFQCPQSYRFIKNLILTDTSEQIRCNAIRLLGWMRDPESIGFLRELLEKGRLTREERYHILLAYCHIGLFNERQDILDEALPLVDDFCMNRAGMPLDCTDKDCAELYFTLGGESAITYFSYCLKK